MAFGNATMYQFNMDSKQAHYIDKLINEIATRRIQETLESSPPMKIKHKKKKSRQVYSKPTNGSLPVFDRENHYGASEFLLEPPQARLKFLYKSKIHCFLV